MIITRMRKLSSSLKLSLWHLVMYQSSDRICCIHYWLLPIEFKDKDGLPVICYQTYIASPKLHDKVILGRPFFKDNLDHVADLSYVKQWIYFDERPIPWVKIVLEKYSQSRPDTTSPYPHNQSQLWTSKLPPTQDSIVETLEFSLFENVTQIKSRFWGMNVVNILDPSCNHSKRTRRIALLSRTGRNSFCHCALPG